MSENQTRCSGDDRVWSEFSRLVTGGDDYLYESKLWSHDRIHMAVDEERTREDGDVKKVLVQISDDPNWNLEEETAKLYTSCAPEEKLVELSTTVGCGGSPSDRLRLGL